MGPSSDDGGEDVFEEIPVPFSESSRLRLVPTPRVGNCVYSCIALGKTADSHVCEWVCAPRDERSVASAPDRATLEAEAALEACRKFHPSADKAFSERVPSPENYEAIAKAHDVVLDFYLYIADELHHFFVNKSGQGGAINLFLSGTSASNTPALRTCSGHLDCLATELSQ